MPDMRIQSANVGLTINNGRVDASGLTAVQAEKLLAQQAIGDPKPDPSSPDDFNQQVMSPFVMQFEWKHEFGSGEPTLCRLR
jgi:hypothetical protein